MLKTYFGLLVLLVILEISVGIAAYAKKDDVDGLISDAWRNSITTNTTTSLRFVKNIQMQLSCCGYANVTDAAYPSDCSTNPSYNFKTSCKEQINYYFTKSLSTIGGAGLAIGLIELLGLALSVVLFRKIAKRENVHSSLLNDSWRINRDKIQYGYQSYQYV